MKTCPNCSAELSARPGPACGWPETTRVEPAKVPLWKRLVREELGPDHDPETSVRGCCLGGLGHLAIGAAFGAGVGYLVAGVPGAGVGALVLAGAALHMWWTEDA
ncbi:MAG: hypothetical protein R3F62_23510 [Planctomycetota bacterium]